MRLTVGFVSLGCPKNLVDTERMMTLLSDAGVVLTGDQSQADIVVINTCGFLEPAKQESMSTIEEFIALKREGSLGGVVVTGCMTERYLDLMAQKFPEVDAFLQTKDFSKISDVIFQVGERREGKVPQRLHLNGEVAQLKGHSDLPDQMKRTPGKRAYAYVKIAEGCNRTCSFCIIPKLRGKLHSRPIDGIVAEIRDLATYGVREILLIAQDLTSYGRDRNDGASLLELLKAIEEIDGIEWVRLHYNYPRFFTPELIEFLAKSKKFARYLDIPFQHISDPVLKGMRRPESSEEIRKLVRDLRAAMPDLSLRTTMMVGFPGETDLDFKVLTEFVKEVAFDHLGAFKFYREAGTPSYDLPNQVPEDIKDRRLDTLMKLQRKVQKEGLKSLVGTTLMVIIDGFTETTKQGRLYRGRHRGQAPEIDGMTYVLSKSDLQPGDIIPVAIEKVIGDYDLLGDAEVAQLVEQRIRNA